jgi:hypothetical protein
VFVPFVKVGLHEAVAALAGVSANMDSPEGHICPYGLAKPL